MERMLILAVGMPRAGSGWHYNLTHDLMLTVGARDAREIRRQYHLGTVLTSVNCNMRALTIPRLGLVLIPVLFGNVFTVKLHAGPTPWARYLIRQGYIRPTYIYRDPRDAALSAYEYGQRGLQVGRPNAFSHLTTIEKAIEFMQEYVRYWEAWIACSECHTIRYEALKTHYWQEATRLATFLGIDPQTASAQAVLQKYAPENAKPGDQGLHFHKGTSGRYQKMFTPAQQQASARAFGPTLEKMGY